MRLLAFAASNSRISINQQFALWAARQMSGAQVETLNIADYELPIYSPEREAALGQPSPALGFLQRLHDADALFISFAEHNGTFTAAWKNLSDWISRIERRYLSNKPVLLLSTSPGRAGAGRVLAHAKVMTAGAGGQVIDAVALPDFHRHYDAETKQVRHPDIVRRVLEGVRRMNVDLRGPAHATASRVA